MDYTELIKIRKALHREPELSGQENDTAAKVVEILKPLKPARILQKVGGTGVVAIFASESPGKTILFRSELDALPIQELNSFDHRSQRDQVSHKCGHDGHTTILLGLAKRLAQAPLTSGTIVLLFQPAEETGEGAQAVLADPQFAEIKPDYVFAFHNLPAYPLHEVVVKTGAFTAAVKSLIVEFHGKTAHAAEPENGINPALPIAEILLQTMALSNNEMDRKDFALITPVHAELGKIAYGTSAGYGELRLTIRTWTKVHMKNLARQIQKIIDTISAKYTIETRTEWTQEFTTNKNDQEAVDWILKAAEDQQLAWQRRKYPFKWGEDFGHFTQLYKGAMFGIGAGEGTPALHNPDYDFPDELIPTGVNLFYDIASKILQ